MYAMKNPSIAPGDRIPDVCLHWGFNPHTKVNMVEYTADQSVLIVGVPAAFAEAVSSADLSKFFQHQAGLKAVGIENVIVYSVNDSAVVGIWNKQLVEATAAIGFPNSLLTFFGDPSGSFTKACGMELEQSPELTRMGLFGRCQTFAVWVDKGVVRDVLVGDSDVINPPVIMQRIRQKIQVQRS